MNVSVRKLCLLVLPSAMLAAALLVPGVSASAAVTLKCGSVLTTSTTLTANVGPCARGGLILGADGITLDLAGFTVSGRANRTGDGSGILLSGRTGVVVRNGRVSDFDAGVAIVGGSGNTVANLLVKDNVGTSKRGNYGDGIAVVGSASNTLQDNDVVNNGPFGGISLVGASSSNLIEGNVLSANATPGHPTNGVRIEGPGATNNTARGNTVTGSGLDGIAVFSDQGTTQANTGNTIEGNTVTANGFGLLSARAGDGIRTYSTASTTVIRNNSVTDNAGSGIRISLNSRSNSILANTATGNARQAAADSFDLLDLNSACDANVWSGNVYGTANQACTTA